MSELDVDGELIANSAIVENDENFLKSINSNILSSKKVNQFSEKLELCFLIEKEIKQWKNGKKFKDPWPKNIVRFIN